MVTRDYTGNPRIEDFYWSRTGSICPVSQLPPFVYPHGPKRAISLHEQAEAVTYCNGNNIAIDQLYGNGSTKVIANPKPSIMTGTHDPERTVRIQSKGVIPTIDSLYASRGSQLDAHTRLGSPEGIACHEGVLPR